MYHSGLFPCYVNSLLVSGWIDDDGVPHDIHYAIHRGKEILREHTGEYYNPTEVREISFSDLTWEERLYLMRQVWPD